MLQVYNRTTWENELAKSILTNTDLRVYVKTDSSPFYIQLCDKNNLLSYRCSSRNSFVCSEMPNDDCEIVILDWKSIPQATRNAVYKGNTIWVYYQIGQYLSTQTGKALSIISVEVDRKETKATIRCGSFLDTYTTIGNNPIGGTNQPAKTPINVSSGEYCQLSAIAQAKGLVVDNNRPYVDIAYKSFSTAIEGYFNEKNIIDDYSFEYDDIEKSNIIVYGFEKKGVEELLYTENISGWTPDYFTFYYEKDNELITRLNNLTTDLYTDKAKAYISSSSFTLNVYGYTINLAQVGSDDKYYIQTYAFENGSTALTNAQAFFRQYYKNNQFITFDCRIDPSFEPLDIIQMTIDSVTYRVILEEVTVTYNGGYKGNIKGRVIGNLLQKPVIENLSVGIGKFQIVNNNSINVVCTIHYSGGSITLNINANSTLSCDIDDNVPQLEMSFSSKSMSELYDDVYCWFSATDYINSENTIILERDS